MALFETMANTYTRIYIHLVFAVLGRDALIGPSFKEKLYKEMNGIVTKLVTNRFR